MFSLQVSVEINQPVEDVFTYVTRRTHALEWMSTLITITTNSSENVQVGSTFQERVKLLNQWVDTTYEVIEYVPGHYFAYKSIESVVCSLVCLRFEPMGNGTRVSLDVKFMLETLFKQAEPLAIRAAQRIIHTDLLTLKDLLENQNLNIERMQPSETSSEATS